MQVVCVLGAPTMSVSSASLVLQGVLYTQLATVSPGVISWLKEPPGALLFVTLPLVSLFKTGGGVGGHYLHPFWGQESSFLTFFPCQLRLSLLR